MRDYAEFKEWLMNVYRDAEGNKLDVVTTVSHLSHVNDLHMMYNRDLDEEFKKDGMKSVIADFPNNIPYQKALKQYKLFCEKHPPK